MALLFIGLALAAAASERPRIDEGYFASPALNLVTTGSMGTPVIEDRHVFMKDIHLYTYWIPPLDILGQAVWYKIWGFSLFAMRGLSATWGLLAMAAWFLIARRVTGDVDLALYTMALVALDYHFLVGGSSGRMDMMSAALGFAALAAYLELRERSLPAAVLVANSLVAASGLTHPVGGYLSFAGLQFLTLYYDRRRIGARHVALALVPYLAGAAGWGWYILKDPAAFAAQFGTNATMDGRLGGLRAPWMGVLREITGRYAMAFGLGTHTPDSIGPIYLKAVILAVLVAGAAGAALTREIRANKGYRALLCLLGLYFLLLSILDAQKAYYYLVHVLPFYAALTAAWFHWLWRRRARLRPVVAGVVLVLLGIQLGGFVLRISEQTWRNSYAPVIAFLKQHTASGSVIIGSPALGFGLGFPPGLIDDARLGFYSGRTPDFIVVNREYADVFHNYSETRPDIYRFIVQRLSREYQPVYDGGGYRVYGLRKLP